MSSLGHAFKYMEHPIKEICFSNNNMTDEAFAKVINIFQETAKLNYDIQKITYANNNDLGVKTLQALNDLIKDKFESYPITHITLVNCKLRASAIQPLMQTLQSEKYPI